MSRRTPETLADYLVVAIAPALIMLLVGSLVFFLIELLHQGEFRLRLMFVMAMFVLGAVCIARISMVEGQAYASMYAAPLGVLVGIAVARFVPINPAISWGLMALVWWATHKLVWDSTLIDDTRDASGAGLLQQMGIDPDAPPAADSASPAAASPATPNSAAPEATTNAEAALAAWWESWVKPDTRPHTPGVWVVYFSLAALPLFGIGGLFLPAGDLETKRRCFWLLVIYVASGLLLLLATSFLGLRKYLRQRRLEMPLEMAASWVGVGVALVAATLVVASLLPRPSPEYSLAHLVDLESLDLQASRLAFGPEGAKEDPNQPSSSAADRQEGQQADRAGGEQTDSESQDSQSDKGQSSQNQSSQNQSGDSQQGSSQSGSSKTSQSQEQSSSNQSQSNQSQSNQADSQQSGDQRGESKSGNGEPQQSSGDSSGKANDPEPRGQEAGQNEPSRSSDADKRSPAKSNDGRSSTKSEPTNEPQNNEPQRNEPKRSESPPRSPSPARQPQLAQQLQGWFGSLGGLVKFLFYAALAIAVGILAWRYRAELAAAWKKLLAELAELWNRWFGGPRKAALADEAIGPSAPPPRPFAAFADPFASGAAARMSPAEVVRYTFQALEAWGRENGCPREAEQTAHEFAAAIGQLDHTLAREAAQLADLYSRLAYAPPAAIRTSFEPLRSLWQKMQTPAVAVMAVGP
jgi:hypothetical protein